MGIVRKQSLIGSALVYSGAILGFLTSAIVFPRFFSQEEIGVLSLLVTYSVLFAQFASAGFLQTITRMFPHFRDSAKQHNGFLYVSLTVVSIATVLMIGVFILLKPYIVGNNADNYLFSSSIHLVVPLFIATVYFNILDTYTKALLNATRGIFFKEVVLRILILGAFGVYIAYELSFKTFLHLYVISFFIITFALIALLIKDKQWHISRRALSISKPISHELIQVSMYGLIISTTSFIILNIDRIMIEKIMPENAIAQVGIYATCSYFATMIILPSRALIKIASTLVSEAWKENNVQKIQELYTKSTITQLIIGILVFVGLCINIDEIFYIIPQTYASGKWVIIIIGVYYLSDMAAGVNNHIIANSSRYKILSRYTGILIALLILLNLILIPAYGITGAAAASCIAKIGYNTLCFWHVHKAYGLQPYNKKHVYILLCGVIAFVVGITLPCSSSVFLNIAIKSLSAIAVYTLLIYKLQISTDINELVEIVRTRINIKQKKSDL